MVKTLSLAPTISYDPAWSKDLSYLSHSERCHSPFETAAKYQGNLFEHDEYGERMDEYGEKLATLIVEHGLNLDCLHASGELDLHSNSRTSPVV